MESEKVEREDSLIRCERCGKPLVRDHWALREWKEIGFCRLSHHRLWANESKSNEYIQAVLDDPENVMRIC